jgi:hypothetical protein
MTIVTSVLNQITNGTQADAAPVMSNFNNLKSDVNNNAAGLNQANAFTVQPTGVAGTSLTSMPIISQIQNNSVCHAPTVTGTADAIVAAFTPVPAALTDGAVFSVNISTPNTIAAPTFDCGVGGAKTIVKGSALPLLPGDLSGPAKLQYNSILGKFLLLNPVHGTGTLNDIQTCLANHCTTNSGGVDTLVGTYTPIPANPLVDGVELSMDISSANLTATPTFNCGNGQGPILITKLYGQPLTPGDLMGVCKFKYTAGTVNGWSLINHVSQIYPQIQTIDASCSGNALTFTLYPLSLDFRSATLGSGVVTRVVLSSQSTLVIPFTATLGTIANQPARLVLLAINNAGVIEPAVVNLAGGVNLDTSGVVTTVAIVAGSNSANTVYSTTQRTNVAYRVVGYIDITEVTPGTWATNPSHIQGVNSEILPGITGFGSSQTLTDFSGGGRSIGTTYYNTTGKAITVYLMGISGLAYSILQFNVTQSGGSTLTFTGSQSFSAGGSSMLTCVVPPGASYIWVISYSEVLQSWFELR